MQKTIALEQLRLGMFIVDIRGGWMQHPFWRSSFLLTAPLDLERLRTSAIAQLSIDTSRGCDVDGGPPPGDGSAGAPAVAPPPCVHALPSGAGCTGMDDEFKKAAVLCEQSRKAVTSMFEEARMGRALSTQTARALVSEISDSVARNPGALISLARLKTADDYTYLHSMAVCALMIALARQLGLDSAQVHQAGLAGLLHDVGKMAVPAQVLNKPGRLTDAEFSIVQRHPAQGVELLAQSRVDDAVLDVCLHHHEKMDGTGYPERLRADQISLFARMGAVCDVYDAITSNRPYKDGWDPAESIHRMAQWAPGHFDPKVFQAFVRSIGIYPVGSLVRLASARLGVVVGQGPRLLTMPQVKVFYSIASGMRIPERVIDLSQPGSADKIVGREDPAVWRFPDLLALWAPGGGPRPG